MSTPNDPTGSAVKPGPKLVILGSGSLFFGRKAIWQAVHSPHLSGGTLGLVDTDPDRARKMGTLAEMVAQHHGVPLKVEWSTDRRDVLADADFVVLSFADRNAYHRDIDCRISEKYGVRMCSGDTIGPGGVLRTMRELPPIMAACRDIQGLCPNAWVVNYINPTAVHGIALSRYFPKLKSLALCDAQYGLRQQYAKVCGVPNDERFTVLTAGPNHFSWLLRVDYDGRDLMGKVIDHVRQAGEADLNEQAQGNTKQAKGWLNNRIAIELYDRLGVLPTVTGHTKEYVPFFQGRGRTELDPVPPLKIWEYDDRKAWTDRVWARVDEYLSGRADLAEFDSEFGPDPATDIIEAMWAGNGKRFFINQMNGSAVPNMARDSFLELYSDVSMAGAKPHDCPPLPRGVRGLCEQVLDTHELTAQAVAEGSRTLLRRALAVDPLTVSLGEADAILDELIEAEKDAIEHERFAPSNAASTGHSRAGVPLL